MSNRNINVTDADIATAHQVRKLLLGIMALPHTQLEHAVQVAHESAERDFCTPPEVFLEQGVTRQALRMFWHFRCNLTAVMPTARKG